MSLYKRQCVALDLGPGKNEGPGNFSTGETAMIYDELARNPFIANGGPLLSHSLLSSLFFSLSSQLSA